MKAPFWIPLMAMLAQPIAARDSLPEYQIENLPGTDDSIQTSLVFRTIAGVHYRVESSGNLTAWAEEEEIYGIGHEFAVAIRQFTPPPPPPVGTPPPTLPPRPEAAPTLMMRPSSGTAGGTVVNWKSLDHGGPMVFFLEDDLHEDWPSVPFFSKRYGA